MKKIQLGLKLAETGKNWGLVAFVFNGVPYIDVCKIIDYTKVAGVYVDMYVTLGNIVLINEVKEQEIIKFELTPNGVVRTTGYFQDNVFIATSEPLIYPTQTIPVQPFINNENGEADIPEEFDSVLETMDYFSGQIPEEWEYTKTMLIKNTMFDAQNKPRSTETTIENGGRVLGINDPDGKLGGSLAALSGGSVTNEVLLNQIMFLENRLLKYLFRQTDTMTGKLAQTNNAEVAKMAQPVLEYAKRMNALRKDQYVRFFDKLNELIAGLGLTETATVDMPLAEIDQYHFDTLSLDLDVKRGQAMSQMATADNAAQTAQNQPIEQANPEE